MSAAEAERLYEDGRMFQSLSNDEHGRSMPKENVFATELDGNEWDVAPALLDYTRSVLLQAPIVLNHFFPHLKMSQRTYGTKLAVSLGAGAKCTSSSCPLALTCTCTALAHALLSSLVQTQSTATTRACPTSARSRWCTT